MGDSTPGFDKTLEVEVGKHFDLPVIRRIPPGRPFVWLAQGIRDMRGNLVESLAYGVVLAAIGWLIWTYTAGRPQQFTASITGFCESLQGWRRSAGGLAQFGLELVLVAILWERLSAILFALFYNGAVPNLDAFFRDVFLSGDYWRLTVVYVVVGGVLATAVFVMCAISIPMLLDRDVDIYTAMATSLIAVGRNIPAMAIWAALIVGLTAIGFATLLIGMIVIFPVLGHATWHAYRDLTRSR